MAARPNEHETESLELDHHNTAESHTDASPTRRGSWLGSRVTTRLATRFGSQSSPERRTTLSSFALVGVALAVMLAGGAVLSGASGSTTSSIVDPQANAVRAIGPAPSYGPASGLQLNADLVGIAATPSGRGYWLT